MSKEKKEALNIAYIALWAILGILNGFLPWPLFLLALLICGAILFVDYLREDD